MTKRKTTYSIINPINYPHQYKENPAIPIVPCTINISDTETTVASDTLVRKISQCGGPIPVAASKFIIPNQPVIRLRAVIRGNSPISRRSAAKLIFTVVSSVIKRLSFQQRTFAPRSHGALVINESGWLLLSAFIVQEP